MLHHRRESTENGGENLMMALDIRETLEMQLKLLSERSHEKNISDIDLAGLTNQMVNIVKVLFPYN